MGKSKNEHFILKKGTIYQEDKSIINIYVPNTFIQILLDKCCLEVKSQVDSNTAI